MRTIKLRVYADGKMHYPGEDDFLTIGRAGFWALARWSHEDGEEKVVCYNLPGQNEESKNAPLMLSTGLYDKHGVEIYEGDLMTHPDWLEGAQIEVKFSDGCFELDGWDCVRTDFSKGEVIGNIYD